MKLFPRKEKESSSTGDETAERLKDCEKGRQSGLDALRTLLETLQSHCPQPDESRDASFRQSVDKFLSKLTPDIDAEHLRAIIDKHQPVILSHLTELKETINEKEREYRDIIAILTRAMADIDADNTDFAEKIFRQSENLEKITFLDDIKTIKNELKKEIQTIKSTVKEKQARDAETIDALSKQVSHLETELGASQKALMRDGLTGLYNEDALNRYLRNVVKQSAVSRRPFAMLIIDIDSYDKIEETYGPGLMERVILAAGQECRNLLQGNEFLARYRRGTFVAILPDESRKKAVVRAKGLSKTIAAKRYRIDEALANHTLSFTVSIGVGTYRSGDTTASLTSRAVQALYAARKSGKGKVVSEKTVFLSFISKDGTETFEDV